MRRRVAARRSQQPPLSLSLSWAKVAATLTDAPLRISERAAPGGAKSLHTQDDNGGVCGGGGGGDLLLGKSELVYQAVTLFYISSFYLSSPFKIKHLEQPATKERP